MPPQIANATDRPFEVSVFGHVAVECPAEARLCFKALVTGCLIGFAIGIPGRIFYKWLYKGSRRGCPNSTQSTVVVLFVGGISLDMCKIDRLVEIKAEVRIYELWFSKFRA